MTAISFVPYREFKRIISADLEKFTKLQLISDMCRLNTLSAIKRAGSGHLGSSLSSMDIFVLLYFNELNVIRAGFDNADRDVFFSSKGHDAPGQYSVLAAAGVIKFDKLYRVRRLGGLEGHPEISIPGMEANTGSLGMGISKAKGIALAKKLSKSRGRVFVLTGDGELQEGQNWEAFQNTVHQGIHNVTVIIDANKIQTDKPVKEIIELRNLEKKLSAFGWHVERCDGHNMKALNTVFKLFKSIKDKPKILIADTIKGKGISFMERLDKGLYKWHSGAPDDASYEKAHEELVTKLNRLFNKYKLGDIALDLPEREKGVAYHVSEEKIVSAYGKALVAVGKKRKDVVVLDADLAADCGIRDFEKAFPGRFVENGISEQDMVSTAGGLALQGYLPIVHSFSVFLAARANEQIYNNATEGKKIIYVCNYAGLLPAGPGRSHQGVRDISLFGALPNCVSIEPCNSMETGAVLDWCVNEAKDSCMIRLSIFPSPGPIRLPDNYRFSFGKGTVLKKGKDAVIFAYGPVMLHEGLAASKLLEREGISLKVVDMPWLNRVDKKWFENTVDSCRAIFVVDNHSCFGGLGDCLMNAYVLSEKLKGSSFRKLAIETYPECGSPAEALKIHGLDAESIAERIKRTLEEK